MSTEPATTGDSTNPSPYIRTYAKDFAELAAKNPGATTGNRPELKKNNLPKEPKPSKPKKKNRWSLSKPRISTQPGPEEKPKTLSPLDDISNDLDSQIQQGQMQGIPRPSEKAEEPFALPKIADGDIVMSKPVEPTIPAPPPFAPTPIIAAPSVFASPVIPSYPAASPETIPGNTFTPSAEGENRAAILARLKERVSSHQLENPPQPLAPVIEQPAIVTPEPIFVPPAPQSLPPFPPEIQLPGTESSSPLHTYTSDFADRIDDQHASTFSVLAAEKDSTVPRPPVQKTKSRGNLLPIVLGVVLLLVGASIAFVAYLYVSRNAPVAIVSGPVSLIKPDSEVQLTGSGSTLMMALADKASEPLAAGAVLLTYVDEATTTSEGTVEKQATGGDFITQLGLPAPDILLRNIDPASMVGIVQSGNETRPFFIMRVDSYERSFAGMLQWEPTMYSNLSALYPLYAAATPPPSITASSTATSSPIFVPPVTTNGPMPQFVDEIVDSHSARALKDTSGRTLIMYGYEDKETLIIARDESAFTLLLSKLAANSD